MVYYFTECINAARSFARVSAFKLMTCFLNRTFSIDGTFRTTIRRTSDIFTVARAYGQIIDLSALWIRSTWWRIAGIRNWSFGRFLKNQLAGSEWIAYVVVNTGTSWHMIYDTTFCIRPTYSWARINAFVSNARNVWRTVRVQDTLRSTSLIGIAEIFRNTFARSNIIPLLAFCIRSAGWRFARVYRFFLDILWNALHKRISTKPFRTCTRNCVCNYSALGIRSAHSWAWVCAFVVYASFIAWTICVDNTFRPTVGSLSNVFRNTLTDGNVTVSWASRIWPTWTRIARIWYTLNIFGDWWNFEAASKWITSLTCWATANGTVVDHFTPSIESTSSGAWINTLFVYASLIVRTLRTKNAFGTAVWRSPCEFVKTRTNRAIINFTTLWIRSTRRWLARILINYRISWFLCTSCECVSNCPFWTWTCRNVIDHLTSSILTTCSRARIYAFVS